MTSVLTLSQAFLLKAISLRLQLYKDIEEYFKVLYFLFFIHFEDNAFGETIGSKIPTIRSHELYKTPRDGWKTFLIIQFTYHFQISLPSSILDSQETEIFKNQDQNIQNYFLMSRERTYHCPRRFRHCARSFRTRLQLQKHINEAHRAPDKNIGSRVSATRRQCS